MKTKLIELWVSGKLIVQCGHMGEVDLTDVLVLIKDIEPGKKDIITDVK